MLEYSVYDDKIPTEFIGWTRQLSSASLPAHIFVQPGDGLLKGRNT
jgi:hypothetical protein